MSQKSALSHIESIDFSDTNELIENFSLKKTRCNLFVYSTTENAIEL